MLTTLRTLTMVCAAAVWAAPSGAHAQEPVGGYGVFGLAPDGSAMFEAVGIADPESGAEVSPDTVFHIASLSKQFTAAALALAILDGKVALDDPVARHIPEAAHYGEALTIAHLVYFTSGLTEPYDVPRQSGQPWTTHHHFTVDEAIAASLSVEALQFAPGAQWRYNNINYQLMAEIVERAYAEPFSAIVKARIFEPLGMTASLVHDDITAVIPNRANGVMERTAETIASLRSTGIHVADEGGPVLIRRNAPHYGGSGVMTSLADWALWQREMLSREVFGEPFWELMMSTQTFDHPKDNDAFGLVHSTFEDAPIVWYAGGDIDASSYMLASPSNGFAAACFSNMAGFDCRAAAEAMAIRAMAGLTPVP